MFKNLFLAFIDSLAADVARILGIRPVTSINFFQQGGPDPWHESLGEDTLPSPRFASSIEALRHIIEAVEKGQKAESPGDVRRRYNKG